MREHRRKRSWKIYIAKQRPSSIVENQSLPKWEKVWATTRYPWDVSYLAEKQRLALYEFDEEELRPYFQLDKVVAGMFDIFSRILSIKVIEEPGVPGWNRRLNITGWRTQRPVNCWGAFTPIGFRAKTSAAAHGWTR